MPLSTYAELRAEVAAWLRRSDLAAEIPTFVALAEAQMNRRLRVRPMLARAAQTWSGEYTDLPADFLMEREVAVIDGGCRRRLVCQASSPSGGTGLGRPRAYQICGGQLRLRPAPDKPYSGELAYVQAIPPLSDTRSSNWLLQSHPDAYLYGALVQSAPYLRADERLQTWATLFTTVLADIEAGDRTGAAARLAGDEPAGGQPFHILEG